MPSPQYQNQQETPADAIFHFRAEKNPRVSVIITGWRSAPMLMECLGSLETGSGSVSYEVIVSLNEPTESLLTSLNSGVSGARVLSRSVNVGFGEACNRAAAEARGEFLVLLNDDAVVLQGWLEALVDAADQHVDAGAVGSRLMFEDGRIQEEGAVLWSDGRVSQLGIGNSVESSADSGLRRVDYCSAASLLVRRSTWESLGGMSDAYFPAYYEDVDFCMKIAAFGQKVLYQPKSTVVHRHGASTTHYYRSFLLERNKKRFVAQWATALTLREPPEPECNDAVVRAARLAETRPLPGPASLAGLQSQPTVTDDADYPSRQLNIVAEYVSQLEATVASADSTYEDLASHTRELTSRIETIDGERVRFHHLATELLTQLEFHQAQDQATRAELAVVMSRRRYRVIDRVYATAKAIPGFERTLDWAITKHHTRALRQASD